MTRPLRPAEAGRLITKSRAAASKLAADSYVLCGFIYKLASSIVRKGNSAIPLFRERGFSTWMDLVDSVCGINASDAGRMRAVWQVFEVDLKGKWKRSLALPSWRKMYLVSRMADQGNVNRLLKKAASQTVKELEQDVRNLIAKLRDPFEPLIGQYNFHAVLSDKDKIESVIQALEHLRVEQGTRSHGDAMFHMSYVYNASVSRPRRRAA